MGDINIFDSVGEKTKHSSERAASHAKLVEEAWSDSSVKRFSEIIDDKWQLLEEMVYDSVPIKSLSDGNTSLAAPKHCDTLVVDALNALGRNQIKEAANLLRRELDFCNMVPKMAGSPYEKCGEAGIEALKQQRPPAEIIRAMGEAWNQAWLKNPAPFYKTD